jgi:UDP-N-acetylmuramoyl-L-alanyl-D-glutamate--2,6-diaminopimelate ligase
VQQILDDALASQLTCGLHMVEPDRRKAIFDVIANASVNDVILIAGKGHENYQDIDGVKHHFDDTEIALEGLKKCWSN